MTYRPEMVHPYDSRTESAWRKLKAQLRHEARNDAVQAGLFSYETSRELEGKK